MEKILHHFGSPEYTDGCVGEAQGEGVNTVVSAVAIEDGARYSSSTGGCVGFPNA